MDKNKIIKIFTKFKDLPTLSPILDRVRDTPIMDKGGKKAPQFNSTIWRLTTTKLGRKRI